MTIASGIAGANAEAEVPYRDLAGFTLIELSIVLVIIGLIVGGILVGQDLIKAAQTRAQIAQIEKYSIAANTFRNKYGGVPGDLSVLLASQFGFAVGTGCNGQAIGQRDGNGVIDGWPGPQATVLSQTVGETALFWEDLSDAGMIDGRFPNGPTSQTDSNGNNIFNCSAALTLNATQLSNYFPSAKIGGGNYVYAYENFDINFLGVEQITAVQNYGGTPLATPDIPVAQAYNLDRKIDDGLPVSGRVVANYIVLSTAPATVLLPAPTSSVSGGSATSCYDTVTNTYSTTWNNGNGPNCAISVQMQGGGGAR